MKYIVYKRGMLMPAIYFENTVNTFVDNKLLEKETKLNAKECLVQFRYAFFCVQLITVQPMSQREGNFVIWGNFYCFCFAHRVYNSA